MKNQKSCLRFLVHYGSTCELFLACDASAHGLGVVLSHKMPDGSDKSIGYASHTLNAGEQNYSQLEKAGYRAYSALRSFMGICLEGPSSCSLTTSRGLLKEDKAVPPQVSARIKRWSLFLSNYKYNLVFRNKTAHANADALSRLPLKTQPV